MNRLSLRNNRLKFETSRTLAIILEESIEYTLNEWKKQNRKMSTFNRLDLESLGSWPTLYALKLPRTLVRLNDRGEPAGSYKWNQPQLNHLSEPRGPPHSENNQTKEHLGH